MQQILCKDIIKSRFVELSTCYFLSKYQHPSKKYSFVCHALSAFKSSLNHNSSESRIQLQMETKLTQKAMGVNAVSGKVINEQGNVVDSMV